MIDVKLRSAKEFSVASKRSAAVPVVNRVFLRLLLVSDRVVLAGADCGITIVRFNKSTFYAHAARVFLFFSLVVNHVFLLDGVPSESVESLCGMFLLNKSRSCMTPARACSTRE